MTIELGLCIALMIAAYPVSRSVALHFAAFGMVNLSMLGVSSVDASALALLFALLAAIDALLVISGGRKVLLISAAVSAALCIESIANMDWLLSRITYLSIAVNAAIVGSMVKESCRWMRGNYGR